MHRLSIIVGCMSSSSALMSLKTPLPPRTSSSSINDMT
uniref:Uncharacterized protein n=1 Tax=Anguilla anguilla TaxID=7936 RepID=A0A0E9S566_ANGAN